jgi:hypothetical protein
LRGIARRRARRTRRNVKVSGRALRDPARFAGYIYSDSLIWLKTNASMPAPRLQAKCSEETLLSEGKELAMSEIVKTPTQTVQTPKEQADEGHTHTSTAKKDDHAHHRHHRHEHAYISPPFTGTSHLNPGSIRIGR